MNAPRPLDEVAGDSDSPAPTLGDLLYADKGKIRVPEKDWAELVRSIAAGNQAALDVLYERTHRIVFTLIMRITRDRQTSEEVTLDVFHDVWRRAARYDAAGGTVIGWIMNQARSRAIDRWRFEQRKKRVNAHAEEPQPSTVPREPDVELDASRQSRALRDALMVLSTDQRKAIEATYFGEMTYAEAAAQLNQPLGTIKTRIRSGMKQLRQYLAAQAEVP